MQVQVSENSLTHAGDSYSQQLSRVKLRPAKHQILRLWTAENWSCCTERKFYGLGTGLCNDVQKHLILPVTTKLTTDAQKPPT